MTIILLGEVVNDCNAVTGFNVGNVSTDDDFVEGASGAGAIGLKASLGLNEMYTTTLGATAPYDFSSTGSEFGWHLISWFNTKTPINLTTGLQLVVGDGTSRGRWTILPFGFYKGGFITAVVNTARDFDVISAGTWTTTGNPTQLTGITQVGGAFTTLTTIMGNFNNIQLDQFTIGLGLIADGGTLGSPNTFEIVRAADEDTNFWGWWSSTQQQIVGKGKLYIGALTGSVTSVFNDTAFSVIWAAERVAKGFYEFVITGSNTDCSWSLGTITAATGSARWSLDVTDPITGFLADSCVFLGADTLNLSTSMGALNGCTVLNTTSISQSNGDFIINGTLFQNSNTTLSSSLIRSENPENISNCNFVFSSGHAIEIVNTGTYTFTANIFDNFGVDESGDAAIFNNSCGLVTINVTNAGSTPTVRNGSGSTTTVNNAVTLTVTCLDANGDPIENVQVDIQLESDDTQILNTTTNASGIVTTSYNYVSDTSVYIDARSSSGTPAYFPETRSATITATGFNLVINMREDNIIS